MYVYILIKKKTKEKLKHNSAKQKRVRCYFLQEAHELCTSLWHLKQISFILCGGYLCTCLITLHTQLGCRFRRETIWFSFVTPEQLPKKHILSSSEFQLFSAKHF